MRLLQSLVTALKLKTMEEKTLIQLKLPKDFDNKLNFRMARLKELNVKRTKADEIIRLASISLLKEEL